MRAPVTPPFPLPYSLLFFCFSFFLLLPHPRVRLSQPLSLELTHTHSLSFSLLFSFVLQDRFSLSARCFRCSHSFEFRVFFFFFLLRLFSFLQSLSSAVEDPRRTRFCFSFSSVSLFVPAGFLYPVITSAIAFIDLPITVLSAGCNGVAVRGLSAGSFPVGLAARREREKGKERGRGKEESGATLPTPRGNYSNRVTEGKKGGEASGREGETHDRQRARFFFLFIGSSYLRPLEEFMIAYEPDPAISLIMAMLIPRRVLRRVEKFTGDTSTTRHFAARL